MPPTDGAKGAAAATAKALQKLSASASDKQTSKRPGGRAQALTVIGSIPKSNASQLRVAVSEWRGERKVELRGTTRVFGSTFFPAGAGVTLDLDKVPQLIALLRTASAFGEAAQFFGEGLMHLVEERPGEAPQGIIVAELAGEAPLAEATAECRCYFRAHSRDPDLAPFAGW